MSPALVRRRLFVRIAVTGSRPVPERDDVRGAVGTAQLVSAGHVTVRDAVTVTRAHASCIHERTADKLATCNRLGIATTGQCVRRDIDCTATASNRHNQNCHDSFHALSIGSTVSFVEVAEGRS